jgi:molybdopterin molybdotransferase
MARKQIDDCFLHDKDRLTHAEALEILKQNISPLNLSESINLEDATGRILAKNITAPRAIPAHRNAAVDGYAFDFNDYSANEGATMPVSNRVIAGAPLLEQTPD